MKIDQIAYYASNEKCADYIKAKLGLLDKVWLPDTVVTHGTVYGKRYDRNVAELQFNYDLGIEVEILRYVEGPNWHQVTQYLAEPFISHIGAHLEDGEDWPAQFHGVTLAQEAFTENHTAEYLTTGPGAGRTFIYRVYELRRGNYFKVIRRVRDNETAYQESLRNAG